MERRKIIYAVIALALTIGIGFCLNSCLVLLNQKGAEKYGVDIVVYLSYFTMLCSLVETVDKIIKKMNLKSNIALAIMLMAGITELTVMLIGMFSVLGNRLLILIIFCASFLMFLYMGEKVLHIEKSE